MKAVSNHIVFLSLLFIESTIFWERKKTTWDFNWFWKLEERATKWDYFRFTQRWTLEKHLIWLLFNCWKNWIILIYEADVLDQSWFFLWLKTWIEIKFYEEAFDDKIKKIRNLSDSFLLSILVYIVQELMKTSINYTFLFIREILR